MVFKLKFTKTRLYFNCEHFFLINIVEQKLTKNSWIFRNFKNRILLEVNFWKFDHPWTFPGVTQGFTQNLGPIGLAVLTFIGYKQTNNQTPRQAKLDYIYYARDWLPFLFYDRLYYFSIKGLLTYFRLEQDLGWMGNGRETSQGNIKIIIFNALGKKENFFTLFDTFFHS